MQGLELTYMMITRVLQKVILFFLIFVLLQNLSIATLNTAIKPQENIHTIVDKLEKRYKSLNTFKGEFEQTITNSAYGEGIKYKGTLYLKKRGKMFWDYKEPQFDRKEIRSNGKTLCMYFPEEKEGMVEDNFDRLKETSGISFLWGEGSLEKQFDVMLQDQTKDLYVLYFIPKDKDFEIQSMTMTIQKKDSLITQITTVSEGRNENIIMFTGKPHINETISDSLFVCKFGKEVTIRNTHKDVNDEAEKNTPRQPGVQKKSN